MTTKTLPWVAVALVITIAGGALLAMTFVIDLPAPLAALGWVLFFAGVAVVAVSASLDARRHGDNVAASVLRGFRAAGRWIVALFP